MTNSSNFADSILNDIEQGNNNLTAIRGQLIQAKKVQLHPNIEGFDSPLSYGIYRHTGGQALGVVGKDFQPMDLHLFMDSIEQSILSCGLNLDLSKLSYSEYKEGAKISFDLPVKPIVLKNSPMVGDIIETKIMFKTGFDGLTKLGLTHMTKRLWCLNGAASWKNDISLSMKNTINNHVKLSLFCNEIYSAIGEVTEYGEALDTLFVQKVKQADIDKFLTDLTGFNVKEYKDMKTERRNILDKINSAIAIEIQNTGANKFSLLQGITRYSTHSVAKESEDSILFGHASKLNKTAHQLVFA
jgi:hypothetical protein